MNGSFAKSHRQAAASEMKDAKAGPFHKALFLFPTGQCLVSTVADMVTQLSTDKRFLKALAELEIICGRLTSCTITFEAVGDAGAVCRLQQQGTWVDCRQKFANVLANSSGKFREDNRETIKTVADRLALVSVVVTAGVLDRYTTAVDTEMGKLLTMTDISDSDFEACAKELDGAILGLPQTPLPLVGSKEEQTAYTSSIDTARSFAKVLRGAIMWQQKPDAMDTKATQSFLHTSAQVFALLKVQTSGHVGPGERHAPKLVEFHGAIARQLVMVCKQRLLDLLSSSQPFIVALTKFVCPEQLATAETTADAKQKKGRICKKDKDTNKDKTGEVKRLTPEEIFEQRLVGDLAMDGEEGLIIAPVGALACLVLPLIVVYPESVGSAIDNR